MLLNASGCLDALTAPDVARSLDAYVTKTITPEPRGGNPPVRIAETEAGMLNAIGLANPGRERFLAEHLPRLRELGVPLWVSVGGFSVEDYVHVAERLGDRPEIEALELNLSCPNVDEVPENVSEVVAAVEEVTPKPLYAKLSATVADLGASARAAEAAGADGLSLVNTIRGLALDERVARREEVERFAEDRRLPVERAEPAASGLGSGEIFDHGRGAELEVPGLLLGAVHDVEAELPAGLGHDCLAQVLQVGRDQRHER